MRSSTSTTSRAVIAAAAVVALWAGFAYDVSRPADARDYQRTLVQAAESAHDAAQTAVLVGELELAGKVTGLFATTAFDDAAKALAGAEQKFAVQGPPDGASAARRDQLGPLLNTAVTALGDTAQAADDARLRDGVGRLKDLAGQLDDFVEAQR
jgi:hypothetical protein